MNNFLVAGTMITSLLSSCSLFSTEPSAEIMKSAVAKWQKIDASAIGDFTKKSCEAGRINYLYKCKFEMTVKDGPFSEKSSVTGANFVSHDSGDTWTASP